MTSKPDKKPDNPEPEILEPIQPGRHLAKYQWKKGQSGNPKGRPEGVRQRLSNEYLHDLHALWQEHGPSILRLTAMTRPDRIVQAVSALVPKEVNLSGTVDFRKQFEEFLLEANKRDEK